MESNNIIKWLNDGNRLERLWLLSEIEFKLRYYGNRLGLLWALINPISQIGMYYFVFEVIMRQGIPNYSIYLFAGLMLWIFFTDCTSRSIGLLKSKKQLYEHTDMNKIEIFMALHSSLTIGLIFNLVIYIVWSIISGVYPTLLYLFFPILYINLLILTFGVSLILSSLFILFEDVNQLWSIVMRFGFFLSPILYRGEAFENFTYLNYINPISGIIINTREIFLYGNFPDFNLMIFDMIYASIILLIGWLCLKKIGPRASEIV